MPSPKVIYASNESKSVLARNLEECRDKVIYASNESKSVLARNLEECRDNDKNSQSVFLSFKCILARNCEGTEQLRNKINQKVQRKLYGRIKICITDS